MSDPMLTAVPVYVISAPSGTGKTTLNRRLVGTHPNIEISVSHTTRPRRPGERDGVDYHFVSREEFERLVHAGQMLEYADVFGNYYGTSRHALEDIRSRGHLPVLEIDVQGWLQARKLLPGAKAIFILPPHVESLWQRLEKRGTDSPEVRWRRLRTAQREIGEGPAYDYFIVNDDLDKAYNELERIVCHGAEGRIQKAEGAEKCQILLREFDKAPWLAELRQKFG